MPSHQRGRRRASPSHRPLPSRTAARLFACCEALETRYLLSGSNAIDEIDFGNTTSEAAHDFEPGYSAAMMPTAGAGAEGETYRECFGLGDNNIDGPQQLTFTMACDPARQNYLTVKLWGSDVDGGTMYLLNDPNTETNTPMDSQGGAPAFPGRFFYYTEAIPQSWTAGNTSVPLTLDFVSYYDAYGGTGTHYLSAGQETRPVYAAYVTTEPQFVADPNSPTGTAPAQSTTTLGTISASQAQSLISTELNSIYGSGGEYSTVLGEQVQPGTSGAPAEVIGLDLFTNVSSWMASNPNATPDQWRNQIATQEAGTGYTAFPDELLSVLGATYLDTPLSYAPAAEIAGYHSSTLMADMVSALDGSTYLQGSDGGFATQGDDWIGLTSTARLSGSYVGYVGRLPTVHGGGDLQGADVYTLGYTIASLLNDPTAGPAFESYLSKTFDADLDGSQMLRAFAYERMLFNSINYFINDEGGTVSQDLFETIGLYADQVALEDLQALYPNPAYPALPAAVGLYYAEQAVGLAPTGLLRGHDESTDYAFSADGLGEANGTYSGGYDGGYGAYLPWGAQYLAQMAAMDPGLTTAAEQTGVSEIDKQARNAMNSYDEFIQPGSNVTFNSNGTIATDQQILTPENFITYRNVGNPNALGFNVNTEFLAADPNGPVDDADALRSVYLDVEYGQTPQTIPPGGGGGHQEGLPYLNYLKSLQNYEDDVNALVGVGPTGTTPLPGEPGQPNYAFADVQIGAVAFVYDGTQFYMNTNFREPEGMTDNLARIDYVTPTSLEAAVISMPYDGTTVQNDGNLTGNFNSPWVVRYGDYLIVLNHSNVADTVNLPSGTGNALDLISGDSFAMGTSVSVAAGQAVILRFASPDATNLAGVSIPAPQGTPAAIQQGTSLIAGFPAITMNNGEQQQFVAEVLNASGFPINMVPQVNYSLASGSIGYITGNGIYTAPAGGAGTATVICTYGGLSTQFTVTVVPFIGPGHDVGTVGVTGTDNYAAGTYTLTGAGTIGGTSDGLHTTSATITGDYSVIGQIDSLSGGTSNAEAGVMIRDTGTLQTTAANSSFADVVLNPAGSLVFQWRNTDGGTVSSLGVLAPSSTPYVEITRSGSSFSAFDSTNGTAWTQIGATQTLTMSTTSQGALIAASGTTAQAATATFSNVQITRPGAEFPTISSISVAWRGQTSTTINTNVTASDGSANTALTYTWIPVSWANNGETNIGGPGANVASTNYNVTQPGTYVFAVEVNDADGLFAFATATATVSSGVNSLSLTNPNELVPNGGQQQLTLQGVDQFGDLLSAPSGAVWSVSGGGTISSSGLYTAPETGGDAMVSVTADSRTTTAIVATAALTNPGIDIGNDGLSGGEYYENGIYTVTGSGAGIGGAADAFHFTSASVSGNFTATTDLVSQSATSGGAGSGLMIRNGTGTGAIFAGISASPIGGNGLIFQWRNTVGGTVSFAAAPMPLSTVWMELSNTNGTVSAFYSVDDVNWTQIGTGQALSLGAAPQVGLAVSSGQTASTATSVFSNVSIVPTAGPAIINPATGTLIVTGTTDAVRVLGSDPNSALTYTWAAVNDSPTSVGFSPNGTTSAANATATFFESGTYDLRVTMSDAAGLSVTSDVMVDVEQTLKSVSVTPNKLSLTTGGTLAFAATALDQFGLALNTQPYFNWTATSGTVGAYSGFYTAGTLATAATVTASTSGVSGSASVTVGTLGIFTTAQDVGTVTIAGASSYSAASGTGTYTLSGSGVDVYSNYDQFQYLYESITGNFTITAYVASETNTNSFAKAGVMVRNSLSTYDLNAMVNLTPSQGAYFSYRTSFDGSTSRSNVASIAAPYWVELTRTGDSFTGFISSNGTTWTQVGSAETIGMNSTVYVGLIDCSHNTSSLSTATFKNVSITQPARTFASNQDIGGPSAAGSYVESSGTITMTGSGTSIGGTSDQFQYGFNSVGGNATLIADVRSVSDTSSSAQAGIMMRNTLSPASAFAAVLETPGNQIEFEWRTTSGGTVSTATVSNQAAPRYLKLVDSANDFTAFYSSNGSSYTQIGSGQVVTMNADYFEGLAVCADDNGATSTVVFTNVAQTATLVPYPTPGVATAAASSSNPVTGSTAVLSVLGSDALGESTLIYTWELLSGSTQNVTFTSNGSNSAKFTDAKFSMAGEYLLEVVISDPSGFAADSEVGVTVAQTETSIAVAPVIGDVSPNGNVPFVATALDQFGTAMASQPGFSWTVVSGGGSISALGVYTAPATGTAASVQATSGSLNGTGSVAIVNQPPLIANSAGATAMPAIVSTGSANLSVPVVDDGGAGNLTYTWVATNVPAGAVAPTFSVNGTSGAAGTVASLYAPGSYVFTVTATDSSGLSVSSTVPVTFNLVTDIWTGAQSNVFSDPFNWSANAAPGSATSVTINDASVQLTSAAVIGGLTLNDATLDVMNWELLINYSANDPIATIQSYLQSGYSGGSWNGTGIISSTVAGLNSSTSLKYAVGYIDGAAPPVNYAASTVSSGQIEIMPTLAGDSTLSGAIDFYDFQVVLSNFGKPSQSWDQGDFDSSGTVDFYDFQVVLSNFGQTSSLSATAATGRNTDPIVMGTASTGASFSETSITSDLLDEAGNPTDGILD